MSPAMPANTDKEESGGDINAEHLRQDIVEVRELAIQAQASAVALDKEIQQRPTRYQIAAVCLTLVFVLLTPGAILLSALISAIDPTICPAVPSA